MTVAVWGLLRILMGINGADREPEDPYEVKNYYQYKWSDYDLCG